MSSGVDLVTLEQAHAQCAVDEDSDGNSPHDTMLQLYITAASRAVLRYLDGAADFLDSDGDVVDEVPEDIQLATLYLVAEWFRNRDAEQGGAMDPQFGYGYLPRPVVAMLYPLRSPVIG